jgi:ABC-2 type transport system permease protein
MEPLLAASVGRGRYLGSHVAVALAGTGLLALVQGAGFAFANAARSGTTARIGATMGASIISLPAVWLMVALVVLAFGIRPRLTQLAWVALIAFLIVAEFGALLDWPTWVQGTSPFAHVPRLPAESMDWTPIIALLAVSAAFAALGAAGFRRRDLSTP